MDENARAVKEEILAIEEKIRELKKRMPAHSVSIEMMQKLEDLEDELCAKKQKLNNGEKRKEMKNGN